MQMAMEKRFLQSDIWFRSRAAGVVAATHLAGRDGGKLDDGLLPMAKPDAKEPMG